MLSWSELFDNLKGDVQEKSKNPFFGAFLFTWSIRHWELFFKVLDNDPKKAQRIDLVRSYFEELPKGDFWITILYTFAVIVLGYLLLNLARIISNLSEKILTPAIYKWTAGKVTIVLKEDYDKVLIREDKVKERFYKEKEEREQLEIIIEKLEKEIIELKKLNIYVEEKEIEQEKSRNNSNLNENNNEINNVHFLSKDLIIDKQVEKLKKNRKVKDFIKISAELLSGISQEKSDSSILFFVSNKLIHFTGDDSNTSYGNGFYGLTDLGNKVLDKLNEFEEI